MKALALAFARITLQTQSPLIVSTGGGDDVADAVCVCDPNGIPMLPGTSLAGLLRHANGYARHDTPDNPFGYQSADNGCRSRLVVHNAYAHDQTDTPVSPAPRLAPISDPVLIAMQQGTLREHVRLNGDGVADPTGKFDERLVPRGARFTFDIWLEGADDTPLSTLQDALCRLLAPLQLLGASLGGRTRRGFGQVMVVRAQGTTFDLRKADDRERWRVLQHGPASPLPTLALPPQEASATQRAELLLAPFDYWMFGRGEDQLEMLANNRTRRTQLTPFRESVIVWEPAPIPRGRVVCSEERPFVVTGTGIKGALRHRTLYHARCIRGAWQGTSGEAHEDATRAERALFGYEPDRRRDDNEGRPGRVFVADTVLQPDGAKVGRLDHVSIDRFTGAPIDGALFGETPLFGGTLKIPLVVNLSPPIIPRTQAHPTNDTNAAVGTGDEARTARRDLALGLRAFIKTLDDLRAGRLPLGGGTGRGHGYVTGQVPATLRKALLDAASRLAREEVA